MPSILNGGPLIIYARDTPSWTLKLQNAFRYYRIFASHIINFLNRDYVKYNYRYMKKVKNLLSYNIASAGALLRDKLNNWILWNRIRFLRAHLNLQQILLTLAIFLNL